jgi:hypothetical protein
MRLEEQSRRRKSIKNALANQLVNESNDISIAATAAHLLIKKFKQQDERVSILEEKIRRLEDEGEKKRHG